MHLSYGRVSSQFTLHCCYSSGQEMRLSNSYFVLIRLVVFLFDFSSNLFRYCWQNAPRSIVRNPYSERSSFTLFFFCLRDEGHIEFMTNVFCTTCIYAILYSKTKIMEAILLVLI